MLIKTICLGTDAGAHDSTAGLAQRAARTIGRLN